MTNALALYAPAPAVARARAARGYPSLALEAHFAAMERRARMSRVAEIADIAEAPKPKPRPPLVLPPARWRPMPLSAEATAEAHAILDGLTTYDAPLAMRPDAIIKREVCREWGGVTVGDIVGDRRLATIVVPRQVAMWLEKETTSHSLPDIARRCGGQHHTTCLHGARKTAERMDADPKFKAKVDRIRERVEIALREWEARKS